MTAYYNEIDPFAAAWLRQLIAAGHIAPGDVDERSIVDVRPSDLAGYTQCHFFAGIGVWSLALRRAGWADDRSVWTGSCPCQPFSAAGKGGGFDDERHLWPHFHWLISQCRPAVVLGEQVASKDGLSWLDLVQADLEGTGYTSGALDTCSAGFGAPHIRQRLYWVAHADEQQRNRSGNARPGRWPQFADVGAVDRLANANDHEPWSGRDSGSSSIEGLRAEPGRRGATGGLGIAPGSGRARFRDQPEHSLALPAGESPGGLADSSSSSQGLEGSDPRPLGLECQAAERNGSGEPAHQSGAGPTNGLWRDADWLFCRDGKWRPVEPRPQQMVDGTAVGLGRVRPGQVGDLELEIAEWAIRHQTDAGKALHDLRCALSEKSERERTPGRLPNLHEPAFLLAFLRQLAEQGWAFEERLPSEGAEAFEDELRVLRHLRSLARPSCERGLDGQQAGECADAMRVLSSILARHAQEAWGRAYDAYAALGFPLAHGARSRVGRLRGYGNAINAQAATGFAQAVREEIDGHFQLTVSEQTNDIDLFS